ncbi:MAG: LuxR C-terminal-related transcriptional regulator [Clostridiales Family XIII bacterium]|nr:LuxR C-terminal-related transcriptional regulator [Clostridiales Family XIII bacterium]
MKRPHIFGLLRQGLQGPLVTVVAGAGYGKTQAVYAFLRSNDIITTWIQLSERDNLVSRFWENYTHTVSLYNENLAAKLADVGFPETETQYDRWLSVLEDEATPTKKYVLVLDDFHLIHNPDLLAFIERIVHLRFRKAITNRTTVLISRTTPDINTVMLASKGLLLEINEDDLRFTKEEILDYFRMMEVKPSQDGFVNICRDTGGWAFAVNLIALSLKHAPTREDLAISAMKLNIFKLIETEIFFKISEELRGFLIRLSLIEHLPYELTKRLAGDAPHFVEEVSEISSFIRYDAYMNAFRIHHLFLDYLTQKQDTLSEEEMRETCRTAARWFEENDRRIDAIAYYEKAGDYHAIVRIAYMFPQIIPMDTARFTLSLIEKGLEELFRENPIAHCLYVRLLMSAGKFGEALAMMQKTIEDFEKLPVSKFNCRVLAGAYNNLGFAQMMLYSMRAEPDLWRSFEKADRYFTLGAPFGAYSVIGPVTNVSLGSYACRAGGAERGEMERYIDNLDRLTPYVTHSMNGCIQGLNFLARAELAYFRCELKEAEKFAYQALYKAQEGLQREIESRAVFYLLRIDLQTGDYAKIQQRLRHFEMMTESAEYPLNPAVYDLLTSWYYAQLGQSSHVADWLKGGFENKVRPSVMLDFDIQVRMRCHWADQRYHELLAFLESCETGGTLLMMRLEFKILEAICLYQIREKTAALRALSRAYELAHPNSFDMPFIEYGNKMRTLSRAAMRTEDCDIPLEWLMRINKKSATYAKKLAFVASEYRKSNHLGDEVQLSLREVEILTDLYHGLSRSEIAVNRRLSINTVKSVLQIIYAKLGAENNMDVIRIALDMKLIG